jgi:hypothetical protein
MSTPGKGPGRGTDASCKKVLARAQPSDPHMIIVSEPSAAAARRVRTVRYS